MNGEAFGLHDDTKARRHPKAHRQS